MTAGLVTATGDQLDAATLYAILRLRAEVFVVEQSSPYLDPDGRDLEPETLHCWVPSHEGLAAYLRVVPDGGARRIGRVVTARSARGQGHAGVLLRQALDRFGREPLVLDAQTPLVDWYRRFGFAPDGTEFVEDGIPHVPMRRPA